ncbi:capsule biosynthesis protein [Shimia sp.]|uniref:capsule biosynthesis protein n=1 Tax=Shimia sp. TaxID=1954381 RepID=UPI003567DA0C
MTTKPKAKKFRIRRNTPLQGGGSAALAAVPHEVEPAAAHSPAQDPAPDMPPVSQQPDQLAAPVTPDAESVADSVRRRREARRLRTHPGGEPADQAAPPDPTPPQPRPQPAAAQAPAAPVAPVAAPVTAPAAAPVSPEQEIAAIKREGLTGRQLRMARRVAQKKGLAATSDYDAVRLLRNSGIDPFQRKNMLELVAADSDGPPPPATGRVQLPQTMPGGAGLPSTNLAEQSPAERRAQEISSIQKDIARRRRRRLVLLLARLSVFVFLPTLLAGWYYYNIATPMYSTKSAFMVQQADGNSGSGLGSLLPSQLNANSDAIAVQDYLTSKDAMIRLDRDVGFKAHFSDPAIDPIQRLEANPSNEEAYKLYRKFVKIGYDPTEGSIRMEVIAADPEVAADFSRALVAYAEKRADDLTQRKREDHVRDAIKSLDEAKAERRKAQAALVSLQESTVIDPEGLIASLRQQISNVQIQLQEKELQLAALEDNLRPNQARVEGVKGDVGRLKDLLATLESKMNAATVGESSLAQKTVRIQMAQADLATADLIMQSAIQTLKTTQLEASRQVRYLTTSVEPVASEDPSYPRAFENTILAFLIFSGIYLMISLTASILREQVTS